RLFSRQELKTDFGIRSQAAIKTTGDIAIDPRATTCAWLRAGCRAGTKIYAPADIVDIDARKSRVVATAANGKRIRSSHLVFATGYEFPKSVPQRGHKIASTWAIATVPQPRRLWPGECMIWEAADPYLYMRTTPDGRVIAGGEDEEFFDE